jgi:hypothetical protein
MDELILKNFRVMRFVQEKTGTNPLISLNTIGVDTVAYPTENPDE